MSQKHFTKEFQESYFILTNEKSLTIWKLKKIILILLFRSNALKIYRGGNVLKNLKVELIRVRIISNGMRTGSLKLKQKFLF